MSEPVYTPNSHKYKEEQKNATTVEKRVQKVVKSPVKTKKNEIRKFADIFISEDVANVKNYIFMDVLVPAIKKAIYDIVTNGIDMFLYGGSGKNKNSSPGTKVSYRSYYDQKNSGHHSSESNRSNTGFEYDDIIFNDRGEAEAALEQMKDAINRYGIVTVADLYDMAGLTAPYTSQKYGWFSVNGVMVTRVRDGYVLKLPKAEPAN
jgi:hypothetical protein